MADKRTVFPIPANTWVRVVNGATAAKIRKSISTSIYYSMALTADVLPVGDIPSNPTAEIIFVKDIDEILADSAATYMYVRCGPDQVGSVIVTL